MLEGGAVQYQYVVLLVQVQTRIHDLLSLLSPVPGTSFILYRYSTGTTLLR